MSPTTGVMCPVAAQVCCAGLLDTNSARYSTRAVQPSP